MKPQRSVNQNVDFPHLVGKERNYNEENFSIMLCYISNNEYRL